MDTQHSRHRRRPIRHSARQRSGDPAAARPRGRHRRHRRGQRNRNQTADDLQPHRVRRTRQRHPTHQILMARRHWPSHRTILRRRQPRRQELRRPTRPTTANRARHTTRRLPQRLIHRDAVHDGSLGPIRNAGQQPRRRCTGTRSRTPGGS